MILVLEIGILNLNFLRRKISFFEKLRITKGLITSDFFEIETMRGVFKSRLDFN